VSLPHAVGPERSLGELSAHWVRANVAAAGAALVLGLAAFGVRQMLGTPDPDAGFVAKAVLFATEVVVAATASAIYAARTGAVLLQKLPRFPMLTWSALHVLMGIVVGVVVAVAGVRAQPAPYETPAPALVTSIAIGGAVAGAFIGAFFAGSLLIETIFTLDGLGLLGFESVVNRDYPVVFATVYIFSLLGLVISLISDLTYTWVDPRIDFETREV